VRLLTVAGVAIAFVLAILLGGFARTVELQELGAWLGAGDGTQPTLQDALAATLGDPSRPLPGSSSPVAMARSRRTA
jgi:hypothetical protein